MKNIFKIWGVMSLIILIVIGLKLLDTSVSLKYEVEEPRAMGMKGEDLDEKEHLLNQLIFTLKSAVVYIFINLVIVSRWLYKNSLINKD